MRGSSRSMQRATGDRGYETVFHWRVGATVIPLMTGNERVWKVYTQTRGFVTDRRDALHLRTVQSRIPDHVHACDRAGRDFRQFPGANRWGALTVAQQ